MKKGYVYILKCSDNSFYTGVTSNLEKRFNEHQNGKYPGSYTHSRRPVTLVHSEQFNSMIEAIEREKQIKNWSIKKKEALINGEMDKLKLASKKIFN